MGGAIKAFSGLYVLLGLVALSVPLAVFVHIGRRRRWGGWGRMFGFETYRGVTDKRPISVRIHDQCVKESGLYDEVAINRCKLRVIQRHLDGTLDRIERGNARCMWRAAASFAGYLASRAVMVRLSAKTRSDQRIVRRTRLTLHRHPLSNRRILRANHLLSVSEQQARCSWN